ncbi:TPA: 3-isopropylmalate dehydratase [candidate division WOR-3 bacterium]|uniref:3-isopropylmalate dehydratase n=1 Tax=candidate division WOR-3 bacterium TaxID=2052148 RepID=A0A350HA04_UNCW3|nr:3-isopropylmalate dehydratase [candidate division WOR-3 bacterium]
MEKIKGKIHIVKDNDVNTDLIYAGKYTYEILTPEEMGKHTLEDFEKDYFKKMNENDFIVSGTNFGCGSSREQAVTCFKGLKSGGIIAKSFSRLYFRNAVNKALLVIESPEFVDYIFAKNNGENLDVEVDPNKGEIICEGKTFKFAPLTGQALEIFSAGGLGEYTKRKLAAM